MVSASVALLRRLCADRRGAAALIFCFSMIPVLIMIGMAIDYARALMVKERLGYAIDAAALAAGSWTGLSEADLNAKVTAFFNANYTASEIGVPGPLVIHRTESTINVSVDGHVPTTILRIVGIDKIDVAADAEITMKQKRIELVMVLDNTGSMASGGRLTALKSAATQLVDTLFGEHDVFEENEVRIGVVPFAAAVNIGPDKLNSGWIDVNALSAIAGEDFAPGVNVLDLYDQISNRSWNGCVRARIAPHDTTDTPPDPAVPATLWAPYFAPDEPDFSQYLNRYRTDGISGSTNYDQRQRYTGKYSGFNVSSSDVGPDFSCRIQPVTPLTNTRATVVAAVDAMTANGSTVIPAGLAWGWRLVSPGVPFTEGVAYEDDKTVKAIILLTDGQNDVGGGLNNHNRSYYSAYGYAREGHLGSTNGSQTVSVLNTKTATLCTAIKNKAIRLYTITFAVNNSTIQNLMRDCATTPGMYYNSPTNDQLQTVFADIAKGLSELRISK